MTTKTAPVGSRGEVGMVGKSQHYDQFSYAIDPANRDIVLLKPDTVIGGVPAPIFHLDKFELLALYNQCGGGGNEGGVTTLNWMPLSNIVEAQR